MRPDGPPDDRSRSAGVDGDPPGLIDWFDNGHMLPSTAYIGATKLPPAGGDVS